MATIKITRGGCGIVYKDKDGCTRHELKTAQHGPFECDDTQAARLVRRGVAEYVGGNRAANPDPAATTDAHLDPAELEALTNDQLRNLAGDLGVDVSACRKKADLVAAIMTVEVEPGEEIDDDLPDLDAADPE